MFRTDTGGHVSLTTICFACPMEVVACNTTFVHYRLYNIYTACNYTFVFVFALAQAYVSSVRSLLHMAHSAFTVYGRRGISSSFGRHATLHSTLWSCIEDDEDHDQWSEGGIQQWKLMQHPKFLKLVSILGSRQRANMLFCASFWHNCAVAATAERKRVQEAAAADDECAAPDVFWPDTDDGF